MTQLSVLARIDHLANTQGVGETALLFLSKERDQAMSAKDAGELKAVSAYLDRWEQKFVPKN